MKQIEIKWYIAVWLYPIIAVLLIWLASLTGCFNNPVSIQSVADPIDPVVKLVKIVPIATDYALVSITDNVGSEVRFHIYRSADSAWTDLPGNQSKPLWRRWIECMNRAMNNCDRKADFVEWTKCVEATATGCLIGAVMITWMEWWCMGCQI